MDYREIHILLDKYFDGTSSLEEEKKLKKFFKNHKNIPVNLQYASYIFAHTQNEKKSKYKRTTKTLDKKYQFIIRISGIAAAILLLISILKLNIPTKEKVIYAYINGKPITNKQIALKETQNAIALIENKLNQGTKDLHMLSKFNESKQLITKNK